MDLLIGLDKSASWEEGKHPREASGAQDAKYKPGEFVPGGQGGDPKRIVHLSESEESTNQDVQALREKVGLRKFVSAGATEEDFHFHAENSLKAFQDLAEVLGLDAADTSFGGKLAMAVGNDGTSALAHYSTGNRYITVATKRDGGTLCHEWFHAFDNLSHAHMSGSEGNQHGLSSTLPATADTPTGKAMANLIDVLKRSKLRKFSQMVDTATPHREIANYYSMLPEVAARAFETYVLDKLKKAGKTNEYLVSSRRINTPHRSGLPIYATAEDEARINAAFDVLWKAVAADRGLLKSLRSMALVLKGVKRKAQPGQLGFAFDESEHPREPAGSEHGGEFKKKDDLGSPVENGPTYRHKFTNLEFQITHRKEPEEEGRLPVYTGTVTKQGVKGFAKFKIGDQHSTSAIQLVNHYDKIDGGSLAEPKEKPEDLNVLHTFTNEEDGTKAVVARHTGAGGGFLVSLHDTEAGEPVGVSKLHIDEEAAIKDAKKLVGQKDAEETGGALAGANSASGGSKTADTGPLYHDTYTGPRFTYGGQNRPLGYAAIPKGHITGSNREHPSFRHGVVDFPRELTPEETYGFELERLYSDSEAGGMSPEQVMTAGAWIEDYKKELPNMSREDKDMMVGVYRAHKQGPAALRTFLDENRETNYYADALADQLNLPKALPQPVTPAEPAVWAMNSVQYLAKHHPGVYEPWIGEISPMQIGMMSDRQRKKYQEGQQGKFAAFAAAKEEWASKIMEAYDRGEVNTGTLGLSDEARSAIHHALADREQATTKTHAEEMRHSNDIRSPEEVNVGDRVFDRMRRTYATVDKKVRGRLHCTTDSGEKFTGMAGGFEWLSYDDLQAAAKAQATKKSLVLALSVEDLEKAARRPTVPSGQMGFSFDEAAHPREGAGQHEGKYHGGMFIKRPAEGGEKPPKMAARTDVHRPAEMVPGDYGYVTSSFPVETMTGNVTRWDNTKEWSDLGHPKDGTAAHSQVGKCDHCGAHHKYQVILQHKGTGELISVGHQCYENRFTVPGWQNLVADKARRAELKERRLENVERGRAGMTEEERAAHDWATGDNAHHIAGDMARKMAEFGSLSDKQRAFMVKLHKEHLEEQKPKPEEVKGEPVPAGKQTVRGVVLGLKFVENDFGGTTKMLVQDERGFKVWGTRPGALGDAEKGALVEFTGTLEPSKDDEHFGFFSRPTRARFTDKPEASGPDAKEIQRIADQAAREYPGGDWSVATIRAALMQNEGDVRDAMVSLLNHFGMGKEARRDYPDLHLAKALRRDPLLLLKAKPQPGQLGFGFNEEDHPREPAGTEHGGQFTKRPEGGTRTTVVVFDGKEYRVMFSNGKLHSVTGVSRRQLRLGDSTLVQRSLWHVGDNNPEQSKLVSEVVAEATAKLGMSSDAEAPAKPEPKEAKVKPIILGINDDVTTCEKCGKQNLKKTVALDFGDGDPQHYGSDCAAAALYGSKSASNRKKIDLQATVVSAALKWMKQTGDPVKVCNRIQGKWGYACTPYRGGLEVAGLHIRADGTIGEPTGAIRTNPMHEPLGGHMPSHVPVGTSTPMTETPGPTQEFRLSKGARLFLNPIPTIGTT